MYEVIWDVEDDVFGGSYSLHKYFDTYEEAREFADELRNDDYVSNIVIEGGEDGSYTIQIF